MPTLKTPHATVTHDETFTVIGIKLNDPAEPIDIMDIQEIYVAFYRQWLKGQIENIPPHDLIQLASMVSRKIYPWKSPV
jgi:hypothetical protein